MELAYKYMHINIDLHGVVAHKRTKYQSFLIKIL